MPSAGEYDVYDPECPSRRLLALIAQRWSVLIVHALTDGITRPADLGRKIGGISQKMLTQTLRKLERDGLLTRTVTPSVPVRVDYELTALGRTLVPVLVAVKTWSETHIEEVMAARDAFEEEK